MIHNQQQATAMRPIFFLQMHLKLLFSVARTGGSCCSCHQGLILINPNFSTQFININNCFRILTMNTVSLCIILDLMQLLCHCFNFLILLMILADLQQIYQKEYTQMQKCLFVGYAIFQSTNYLRIYPAHQCFFQLCNQFITTLYVEIEYKNALLDLGS